MPPIPQPNNPQQPPGTVLGQGGQPANSPESAKIKLLAKSFEEAAKYASSAEDKLRRWADAAYKMNVTMDDAARLAEDKYRAELKTLGIEKLHSQQLSGFASRNNMSWEQIMKMPLPELAKNFDGVAKSIWGIVKLPLTLQAVVAGFKMIDETLTSVNRASGAFATASGSAATSGDADLRDPNNRARVAGVMSGVAKMGTDEEIQQAMMTMARSLPASMAKESGPEWASAALATARVWNTEITKVAKLQADLLRSGVSTETISNFFGPDGKLSRLAKDIPADEIISGTADIAQAARMNAMSYGIVGKALDGFVTDISRGKASFKEVANALSKAGGSSTSQYLQLAAMGGLSGSGKFSAAAGGGSVAEQAEALIKFEREFPRQFQEMLFEMVQLGGEKFGALPPILARKAYMEGGPGSFFATKTSASEAAFGEAPSLPQDMSKGSKVSEKFKDLEKNATDFQDATNSLVSEFARIIKSAKYTTMAIFEMGRAANAKKSVAQLRSESMQDYNSLSGM